MEASPSASSPVALRSNAHFLYVGVGDLFLLLILFLSFTVSALQGAGFMSWWGFGVFSGMSKDCIFMHTGIAGLVLPAAESHRHRKPQVLRG